MHLPTHSLILVAVWLITAVIIHDGLLSPVIVGFGSGFHRWVPDRGRRYLQAALIIGAVPDAVRDVSGWTARPSLRTSLCAAEPRLAE